MSTREDSVATQAAEVGLLGATSTPMSPAGREKPPAAAGVGAAQNTAVEITRMPQILETPLTQKQDADNLKVVLRTEKYEGEKKADKAKSPKKASISAELTQAKATAPKRKRKAKDALVPKQKSGAASKKKMKHAGNNKRGEKAVQGPGKKNLKSQRESEKTGRWTEVEHEAFKQGLELYGKEWVKVAELVGSRSVVQTRTHAQKYFQRLLKVANMDKLGIVSKDLSAGKRSAPSTAKVAQGGGGNGAVKKEPTSAVPKVSPGSLALLARTSAGAEGIKKLSDEAKYLELAMSGTASSSRATKDKESNTTGKSKPVKKVGAREKGERGNVFEGRKKRKSTVARPKPVLHGLHAIGSGGTGVLDGTPGTPWGSQVESLRDRAFKKKKKNNQGKAVERSVNLIGANAAAQRPLRYPPKRTPIHEAVLSGNLPRLVKLLDELKKEDSRSKSSKMSKSGEKLLGTQISSLIPRPLVHPPMPQSILEEAPSIVSGISAAQSPDASVEAVVTTIVSKLATTVESVESDTASVSPAVPALSPKNKKDLALKVPNASMAKQTETASMSTLVAVNHPDMYGYTPLMVAAALDAEYVRSRTQLKMDDAKMVPLKMCEVLVQHKASCKYTDRQGYNALHWAAARGNTVLLPYLLKHGCPIDAQAIDGNTALHLASCEGRVESVQYLVDRNANIYLRNKYCKTSIDLAATELPVETLTQRKSTERLREEIRNVLYKSNAALRTLLVHHEECQQHKPRKSDEWEHPERIEIILKEIEGTKLFNPAAMLEHTTSFDRATVKELLRVHSAQYIRFIHDLSMQVTKDGAVIPFTPKVQKSIGKIPDAETKEEDICDTSFSRGSLPAARRAVGAVCHAIDRVLSGKNRNAFCTVRPPGHHAGTNGLLKNATSCGFCIFNNVAVGAMHALEHHGLERVAIIDFDVHHGNGTEEIIGSLQDPNKIFFFSAHLFDRTKSYEFYPGTGKTDILSRNVINVPMKPLWRRDACSSGSFMTSSLSRRRVARPGVARSGRAYFRQIVAEKLLPALRAYNPEIILLSSGFDGSEDDVGNCNHSIGARSCCGLDLKPVDYFWATAKVQEVASICCDGKLVSVLEGGYGQYVRQRLERKNLANCVVAHVAALVDHENMPLFLNDDDSSGEEDEDDSDSSLEDSPPLPTYADSAGLK